jgi:hypothetical protein
MSAQSNVRDAAVSGVRDATPPIDARVQDAWERSARDWEWLRSHPEVLQRHAGRWICMVDRRVVVSEADDAAFHEAFRRGEYAAHAPLVMRVPLLEEWQEVRVL